MGLGWQGDSAITAACAQIAPRRKLCCYAFVSLDGHVMLFMSASSLYIDTRSLFVQLGCSCVQLLFTRWFANVLVDDWSLLAMLSLAVCFTAEYTCSEGRVKAVRSWTVDRIQSTCPLQDELPLHEGGVLVQCEGWRAYLGVMVLSRRLAARCCVAVIFLVQRMVRCS